MVGLVGAGAMAGTVNAATAKREPFGALPDGTEIESVVLTGKNGVSARIVTLGAALQSLKGPDRSGHNADVTLGYDDAASYATHPNFWGQTVGRYANRIAGADSARCRVAGMNIEMRRLLLGEKRRQMGKGRVQEVARRRRDESQRIAHGQ